MDPRHLLQLATILEKGSITKASRFLHLTQPTLTHNMQTLEMQVGGRLFVRSRLGVRSTPLGELLAREGRDIQRRVQDAVAAGARHRLGLRNQVRIGAGPMIGAAVLPELTAALLEKHADIALMLHSERPHLLVEQLVDGLHDLVIAPSWLEQPPQGIARELLIDDHLAVYCGPAHRLAAAAELRPGQADDERWLTLGVASPFDKAVFGMLDQAGIAGARVEITTLGDAMVLLRTLMLGRHLTVLPWHPVRLLQGHFPIVELAIDAPARARPIFLWYREALLENPFFVAVKQTMLATVADAVRGLDTG